MYFRIKNGKREPHPRSYLAVSAQKWGEPGIENQLHKNKNKQKCRKVSKEGKKGLAQNALIPKEVIAESSLLTNTCHGRNGDG